MKHYRQRVYENSEGNQVSDRYNLYNSDEFRSIELEKDLYLDEISYKYYGTPLYYWVIGEVNSISDPFIKIKKGTNIKVPVL